MSHALLHLKHRLVRTPLEPLAMRVQSWLKWRKRRQNPELMELFHEDRFCEQTLHRLLREDSNCVDVGCHIGSMLSFFCRVAPRGMHMGFEPTPFKAAWLRRKFSDMQIHEVALGERPGSVTFHENVSRPGFSALGRLDHSRDTYREYEVEMNTLDAIVGDEHRVDLIKVDVEGAELGVLRGARKIIARCRPHLLFECGVGGPEKCGYTRRGLHEFVTDELACDVHRFRDYLDGKDPMDWEAFERCNEYPFTACNFLAVPKPN